MSWFDEQIKYRKQHDDEEFSVSIEGLAGAVMGKRLAAALNDRVIAQSAMEEIGRCFGVRVKDDPLPPKVKTLDEQLEYRLRPFGIMRRPVELGERWYKDAFGPMLGTMKADGAVVALLPRRFGGYYWFDRVSGKKVGLNKKTAKLLDSEAIAFYRPLPAESLGMLDLVLFMIKRRNPWDTVLNLTFLGALTALGLLTPLFTKWLFGAVLSAGSLTVLLALASFMVCFSVTKVLISAYQTMIHSRISTKEDAAVQAAVMHRLLSLPTGFFKQYAAGELMQRSLYVSSLCSMLTDAVGTVGLTSLFSLVYIGQIFAFAPALTWPAVIVTLLSLSVTVLTTVLEMRKTRRRMELGAKTSGMTYAMITGIQKIKLAGAEKRMFARWAKDYAKEAALAYNPNLFLKLSSTFTLAVSLLGTLFIYAAAVQSHVSVEDYFAFSTAFGMISAAFLSLSEIAEVAAAVKPTLEMARPILKAQPEPVEGKEIVTSISGSIELDKVSFRYDEQMPNVIDGLSLKIRAGEYVAIVGKTGCGKSTLMRLLLGFETPQKGSIYYDRRDITRVDLKSLRQRIGAVTQDGRLFMGDIYSNIVIAAPQLGLDAAWEAAEMAAIADDIRAMPMGMHTIIAEGQGGISGGQRQRLMIARALAPKPKILMFDEATSALDNVTQKKISDAIDALKCTRVVIAHRLSTIRHCDRIIVLDGGRIAEEGSYEQLLEKNGLFAELVERQRLDVEPEEAMA